MYGLNQSSSFDLEIYGETDAVTLAVAWCDRMDYFYELWLGSRQGYVFTQSDIDAYEEGQGFKDVAATCGKQTAMRVRKIRAIKPTRPCA